MPGNPARSLGDEIMFTTFSTEAGNGKRVIAQTSVLEYATRKPWRVQVYVNGAPMSTAHFTNRADADKHAETMHNTYLKVHASKASAE